MLRLATPQAWLTAVLAEFDEFLLDHAANERKASAMAMSLVAHYPDKIELVTSMVDLALEELNHFRQVLKLATARGLHLAADEKDPYVNRLRQQIKRGADAYFLDRLLCASVIEWRGAERFSLLADALPEASLRSFYHTLARSEQTHQSLFIDLAKRYFPASEVNSRLDEWLDLEAGILSELEIRPRLH